MPTPSRLGVWVALIVSSTGCASPPAAEGPPLELGGTWTFAVDAASPVTGTLTFLENQEVLVNCVGEKPARFPRRYDIWAGREARFGACGVTLRVVRGESGLPEGLAEWTERRPYRVQRVCGHRDSTGRCRTWNDRELYRESNRQAEVTFERAGGR